MRITITVEITPQADDIAATLPPPHHRKTGARHDVRNYAPHMRRDVERSLIANAENTISLMLDELDNTHRTHRRRWDEQAHNRFIHNITPAMVAPTMRELAETTPILTYAEIDRIFDETLRDTAQNFDLQRWQQEFLTFRPNLEGVWHDEAKPARARPKTLHDAF